MPYGTSKRPCALVQLPVSPGILAIFAIACVDQVVLLTSKIGGKQL